jgi:hypothetical protein
MQGMDSNGTVLTILAEPATRSSSMLTWDWTGWVFMLVHVIIAEENFLHLVIVRYHCGGWSEEVNSCILILSYMVYL